MIKQTRRKIIQSLWEQYRQQTPQILPIEKALQQKGIKKRYFDHLAIIDLPSPHTGIPVLSELFTLLGFIKRGEGYLKSKQNDFCWLAEADSITQAPHLALPQVVVADFRLAEMPPAIRRIIEKYAGQAQALDMAAVKALIARITETADENASQALTDMITSYLSGRDWSLPTLAEFYEVQQFNELLAWVLVFGRRPNHFTLSIHLLNYFKDLSQFQALIEDQAKLTLNKEGGAIKGGPHVGIAQGSTLGMRQTIALADGIINIPTGFVEFVWRYPRSPSLHQALRWEDYYTGFIPQQADHVIESLYVDD